MTCSDRRKALAFANSRVSTLVFANQYGDRSNTYNMKEITELCERDPTCSVLYKICGPGSLICCPNELSVALELLPVPTRYLRAILEAFQKVNHQRGDTFGLCMASWQDERDGLIPHSILTHALKPRVSPSIGQR